MTLDDSEVKFLASRLRRLFALVNYPLPDFASDDARLIGIAGAAIGAVLLRHEAPCDMGAMCIGCTPRLVDGSCPGTAGVSPSDAQTKPPSGTDKGESA